jgi:hypothetical protein
MKQEMTQMPKLMQVIQSEETEGKGVANDPYRRVTRYYTPEGDLLAENDSYEKARIPQLLGEHINEKNDWLVEKDRLVAALERANRIICYSDNARNLTTRKYKEWQDYKNKHHLVIKQVW